MKGSAVHLAGLLGFKSKPVVATVDQSKVEVAQPAPEVVVVTSSSDEILKKASIDLGSNYYAANGVSFRVTAMLRSSDGVAVRGTTRAGEKVIASAKAIAGEMYPMSLGMSRIATLLRIAAFVSDFDRAIKEIIAQNGLPVDETMDWNSWLNAVYYKVAPGNEDAKEEAIHNMIYVNLLHRPALKNNFADGKVPKGLEHLPREKQVTEYLKTIFRNRVSEAIDYLTKFNNNRNQHIPMDQQDEDGETYNLIDQQGGVVDDHSELEFADDVAEFREAFAPWLLSQRGERVGKLWLQLFDILVSLREDDLHKDQDSWDNLVKIVEQKLGRSAHWLGKNLKSLGKFLTEFVSSGTYKSNNPVFTQIVNKMKQDITKNVNKVEETSIERATTSSDNQATTTYEENTMASLKEKIAARRAELDKKTATPAKKEEKRASMVTPKAPAKVAAPVTEKKSDFKARLAALRAKKEAKKASAKARFAKLLRIAEEQPEEMGNALSELKEFYLEQAEAVDDMMENMDLDMAPDAEAPAPEGIEASKQAGRKFAAAFRRLAEEAPEQMEEAVVELYLGLDDAADAIETLADNLGIVLEPKEEGAGDVSAELPATPATPEM